MIVVLVVFSTFAEGAIYPPTFVLAMVGENKTSILNTKFIKNARLN